MRRFIGDRAQLGYHDHYVVDGGKVRIIRAGHTGLDHGQYPDAGPHPLVTK